MVVALGCGVARKRVTELGLDIQIVMTVIMMLRGMLRRWQKGGNEKVLHRVVLVSNRSGGTEFEILFSES